MTDNTTNRPHATDWNSYKGDFEQKLQQIPPQREFIQNAAESFGQSLGQKAQEAGVSPDDIVNKLRTGMQHGHTAVGSSSSSGSGPSRTSPSDR